MYWTKLGFGRRKGSTLPQILFADPDWFFWAYKKNVFDGIVLKQAEFLYPRARHIRLPKKGYELVVKYVVGNKFRKLEILPAIGPPEAYADCDRVIDLGLASAIKSYDKIGSSVLVKAVKRVHFGKTSVRMTVERCAEFFEKDDNFYLPDGKHPLPKPNGGYWALIEDAAKSHTLMTVS